MSNRHASAGKACRKARRLCASGRLAEARAVLEAACRREPRDARAWALLGMIHGRLGEPGPAAEACRRSLAIDPRQADVHANLGIALEALGDARGAIASHARAIRLDPAHVEARKNLAALLAAEGRHDESVAHYEAALRHAPRHPGLHNDLANALVGLDRLDEAERHYREALACDPGFLRARINLAAVQFRLGDRQASVAALEQVLDEAGDDPDAHHNLGEMLQRMGMPEQALRHYDTSLRLRPGFAEALSHRATVLQRLGRHDEAGEAFEQALALRPDDAGIWVNRGLLKLECGRIGEALTAFGRAIDGREDFAEAWNNLGNALVQSGRQAEAIAAYERAVRLRPGYREAESNRLLALHYAPAPDWPAVFAAHREWGERRLAGLSAAAPFTAAAGERLRIGYVSADFRTHSVACFIEPVLRAHDPGRAEATC